MDIRFMNPTTTADMNSKNDIMGSMLRPSLQKIVSKTKVSVS
jgi:hypothetical protein